MATSGSSPASLPSDRLGRMFQFQGMRPSAQFPMTTPLPALSFCVIEDVALFLDLARDRYFRLPETANAAFLASLVNGVAFAPALQSAGLDQFVSLAPLRAQGANVHTRECADLQGCGFSPYLIARSLWEQRAIERRLAKRGLHTVLSELQSALRGQQANRPLGDNGSALVKAFEDAALVRSTVDRCLSRSVALARLLARSGYACQVIIGVKLRPFAAHCWVQAGHLVLNESVEEAARYIPILVL